MPTITHFNSLDITSIDLSDRTYYLSPLDRVLPEDALIESVRRFGILHPPLVKQQKNHFIVVTGRKRILAAGQTGRGDAIMCFLIPEDTEEEYVYELIIEESFYGQGLSVVEQAVLFDNLLKLRPAETFLPLLARLGHKPQKYVLAELVSLLALGTNTLLAVHNGVIPLKSAQKLRRLTSEDQEVLTRIITSFHLGGSKQNKLIDYCTELSMRANLALEAQLREFLTDDRPQTEDNIPQQAAALLNWLHHKCFPGITNAEDEFRRSVARLRLPDHLRLDHSLSFEEEKVTLSVQFPDMESARQALPEIIKITGNGTGQR